MGCRLMRTVPVSIRVAAAALVLQKRAKNRNLSSLCQAVSSSFASIQEAARRIATKAAKGLSGCGGGDGAAVFVGTVFLARARRGGAGGP